MCRTGAGVCTTKLSRNPHSNIVVIPDADDRDLGDEARVVCIRELVCISASDIVERAGTPNGQHDGRVCVDCIPEPHPHVWATSKDDVPHRLRLVLLVAASEGNALYRPIRIQGRP